METPESMKAELAAWNNGAGIAIKSWIACEGNFSLAVGYASVFWPKFVVFEGYILREGFRKRPSGDLSNKKVSIANQSSGI
jgi:hypothetical protein